MYEYRMVPLALTVSGNDANAASSYLEGVVGEQAASGWEFYRIDSFEVHRPQGCLNTITMGMLGQGEATAAVQVATFRRPNE